MSGDDVVELLARLDAAEIVVWVDGGWGVDALVGRETRQHSDLDLAISRDDLPEASRALEELGFRHDLEAEPGLPARVVMTDERAREVDFHPLLFDGDGNGWQQLSHSGRAWGCYEAAHLGAEGLVNGRSVRCLSPELQLRFRRGHELSDRDVHDIRLLANAFALPIPPPLRR